MKILIVGAGGFLGSAMRSLIVGHEIMSVTRQDLDLLDYHAVTQLLSNEHFDWIINCAVDGRYKIHDTNPAIVANNLQMFCNLYTNLDKVKMGMISFGSGAEFGIDRAIDRAKESDIWHYMPTHSYGHSKNMIARLSTLQPKCYTVRIFGCFGPTEDYRRPIKKLSECLKQHKPFVVDQDRWFDMISVTDLVNVVQYILTGACGYRDVNAVYNQKTRLSDIFRVYCNMHGADPNLVQVLASDGLSYTGSSDRLDTLNLPLLGLKKSLEMYGK